VFNRKDGSGTTSVFTHTRTAGDPKPVAYVGTWTNDRALTKWGSEPLPLVITESGGHMTMSLTATNTRLDLDLGKSTVTATGDNLASDTKRTVRKIDDRTIELGTTRGPVSSTTVYNVSSDGKTMTVKFTGKSREGKPLSQVFVYERQ
jgi:hypothetical protein